MKTAEIVQNMSAVKGQKYAQICAAIASVTCFIVELEAGLVGSGAVEQGSSTDLHVQFARSLTLMSLMRATEVHPDDVRSILEVMQDDAGQAQTAIATGGATGLANLAKRWADDLRQSESDNGPPELIGLGSGGKIMKLIRRGAAVRFGDEIVVDGDPSTVVGGMVLSIKHPEGTVLLKRNKGDMTVELSTSAIEAQWLEITDNNPSFG